MADQINIFYADKSCELPKQLINNEVLVKEIISANVWNNQLQKSDKVNLLKFLPSFPKNDTREKKETLKKIFLGKSINFENQIHKFVQYVKGDGFDAARKSENALEVIMDERKSKIRLLKRRINDLQNIIESKKKMGMNVTKEEIECLDKFSIYLKDEDPLDSIVDDRFKKLMLEISSKESDEDKNRLIKLKKEFDQMQSENLVSPPIELDKSKLTELISQFPKSVNKDEQSVNGKTGIFDELQITNAINQYLGSRKRKLNHTINGCSSGKSMKLHYEQCSSADSMSEASYGDELDNNYFDDDGDCYEEEVGQSGSRFYGGGESISETDSINSCLSKKKHEVILDTDFQLPQHDFSDFFSLLQILFQPSSSSQQLKRPPTVTSSFPQLPQAQLESRVRHWQSARLQQSFSSIYYCNTGWIDQCKDWSTQVSSALNFLLQQQKSDAKQQNAFLEYKKKNQTWIWKKDRSADELSDLFFEWRSKIYEGGGSGNNASNHNSSSNGINNGNVNRSGYEDVPAPLCPTEWVCRPYTPEEKANFHSQERRRFLRPWRGFVYNVTGYDCAVAPLRGCIHTTASGSTNASSAGGNSSDPPALLSTSLNGRARGHPLLLADRPAHVTIVEIVRDAVARLPNGQGSRADIAMLAAESQYWAVTSTEQNHRGIAQCVSSALDRLQGEQGGDPSVKYNSRLKLWFYRHRHKTMAELEITMIAANAQTNSHVTNNNSSINPVAPANPKSTISTHHPPASSSTTPAYFLPSNSASSSSSLNPSHNLTPVNTAAPPSYFHHPTQFIHTSAPPHINHHPHHHPPPSYAYPHPIGSAPVGHINLPPSNASNPANIPAGSSYQQFSQAISNARELLQHQPPIHNRLHTPSTIRLAHAPSSLSSGSSGNHHHPPSRVYLFNPVTGQQHRITSTSSVGIANRSNSASINTNNNNNNNNSVGGSNNFIDKYTNSNVNNPNYYPRY